MAAPSPTRADTWRLTVTIDGEDWGVFDKKTGGKVNANGTTYKPGNMVKAIALGGVPTSDSISLQRNYDRVRDHSRIGRLVSRVGKGRVVVKQRPLDLDGNGYGDSIIWSGILDGVAAPDVDSESTSAAMLELDVIPDEPVTTG